jgi:hypothetical protein
MTAQQQIDIDNITRDEYDNQDWLKHFPEEERAEALALNNRVKENAKQGIFKTVIEQHELPLLSKYLAPYLKKNG